jgi:hypothetical protein
LRLFRALPHDPGAAPEEPGGGLWFPRRFQGEGRHDNPDLYGCLYACELPVSAVAEALAAFRGSGPLLPEMLTRFGLGLALVELALDDEAALVDLDDPAVLRRERLRPSVVATRRRMVTQAQAARLHAAHHEAAGLRWWSTLESSWINVTLFDRAAEALAVADIEPLVLAHPVVGEAGEFLGLIAR